LAVQSVSDAITSRDAGVTDVAVRGFWSSAAFGHSCAPPEAPPGDLEIYCHDGEWGITEFDDLIMHVAGDGTVRRANGPFLTPWFPPESRWAAPLFGLAPVNGQLYPPVPIVIVGHFDDQRASACRELAREICADRLVVDDVPFFEPGAAVPPGETGAPTGSPPDQSGLFDPRVCAGDIKYSFAGWTSVKELGLDDRAGDRVWAVVSAEIVPLGNLEWVDAGAEGRFRWWGQMVCFASQEHPGLVLRDQVPGTSFKEWDDGRHTSSEP
jgi:hypothetical protein